MASDEEWRRVTKRNENVVATTSVPLKMKVDVADVPGFLWCGFIHRGFMPRGLIQRGLMSRGYMYCGFMYCGFMCRASQMKSEEGDVRECSRMFENVREWRKPSQEWMFWKERARRIVERQERKAEGTADGIPL